MPTVSFKATLLKFASKGEKTGWTYIHFPADVTNRLKKGVKTTFRVKGKLDDYAIKAIALLPMGDGDFIMPVNGTMRKALKKKEGAMVQVNVEADNEEPPISADFLECLADEPEAQTFFESLTKGHQRYFSNWIDSAKTPDTKAKRIAMALKGLSMRMDYGQMIRHFKAMKS